MQTGLHIVVWAGVLAGITLMVSGIGSSLADDGPTKTWPADAEVRRSAAYQEHMRDVCNWTRFNRAHMGRNLEFIDRAPTLAQGEGGDLVLVALRDRAMAGCWDRAAEVIGYAGSYEQLEEMVATFEDFRLGKWLAGADFTQLLYHSIARRGLGIGAGRYPGTALTARIVEHLKACSLMRFWRGDRSPQAPQWQIEAYSAEKRAFHVGEEQLIRCISALGMTQSPDAIEFLERYKKTTYMQHRALQLRADLAIELARELKRLGIRGYIEKHGSL